MKGTLRIGSRTLDRTKERVGACFHIGRIEIGGARHQSLVAVEGVEAGFDLYAAAQAPGRVDDLSGESVLERALGSEGRAILFAKTRVVLFLAGRREAGGGKESKGSGISGGPGFAGVRNRAGGRFRVVAIGGDLGFSSHGLSPSRE